MNSQPYLPIYTKIGNELSIVYRQIPIQVLDYPFFNDGVAHMTKNNFLQREVNLTDELAELNPDLLTLKGFIFHTAHCGSTLLVRMLNSAGHVRVISETEAINGLLLAYVLEYLSREILLLNLRRVIEAYRERITDKEKYLVFKLTSWNVYFIDIFQELYPNIEWIYIDRKIKDTVNSLMKSNSGFVHFWEHPVDTIRKYFISEENKPLNKRAFLLNAVQNHRKHAHKAKNEKALFIEYPYFIKEFDKIILHFKLEFDKKTLDKARARTQFESKTIQEIPFRAR